MNSKVQDALKWLRGLTSDEFCWCGHTRGHSLGNCHKCGQPFKDEVISRGEMMLRWRRAPIRESLREMREHDRCNVMFSNWRYQRTWPTKPDYNDFKLEDFKQAFALFEAEVDATTKAR